MGLNEKEAKMIFDMMDSDNDGKITGLQLAEGLMCSPADREDFFAFFVIFAAADKNRDDIMTWPEFKAVVPTISMAYCGDVEAQAKLMWDAYPKKNKNSMTKGELKSALEGAMIMTGRDTDANKKMLNDALKMADKDKDGVISFKEFKLVFGLWQRDSKL